jgi:hypothetical protein
MTTRVSCNEGKISSYIYRRSKPAKIAGLKRIRHIARQIGVAA